MNFAIACIIAGLLIIAVSVFFAYLNRFSTKKCIACLTLGVFFASFFLIIPTQWLTDGKEYFSPILYRLTSSLVFSLKTISSRPDIDQIETIALEGWMRSVYIITNYAIFIAIPILTSGFILSFFGDTGEKIKYYLRFSPKCCVFSDVNENSLALAESLRRDHKSYTIVFCNTKNTSEDFLERAKRTGAVLLYKSCVALKPSFRFGCFEYYLISVNEDDNIRYAEEMNAREIIRKHAPNNPVAVNVFFRTLTKVKVLESVTDDSRIRLRFINELALFCNHLVSRNPLYRTPDGGKAISVMIVGCDVWGMQMLKTVIAAGQIDGYSLKIRVYDKNAIKCESIFYRQCPELKNLPLDIRFIETDVSSFEFLDVIRESNDATYICIATGDDDLNLDTSISLFKYFYRRNGFRKELSPPIYARIKNDIITDNMTGRNESYLRERNIELFGTVKSYFYDGYLFDSFAEQLAIGVQLCYSEFFNLEKGSDTYKERYRSALHDYYESDYNRRSSMAAALHLSSKILMCNGEITGNNPFSEENIQKYIEGLSKTDVFEKLVANEHNRWNYYMAADGFSCAKTDEVKAYYNTETKHKDTKYAMLHPCMIPFDDLSSLDDELTEFEDANGFPRHGDFIKYDRLIVSQLPQIVEYAKSASGYKK